MKKDYVGWPSFLILMAVALLAVLNNRSRLYPAILAAIREEWT